MTKPRILCGGCKAYATGFNAADGRAWCDDCIPDGVTLTPYPQDLLDGRQADLFERDPGEDMPAPANATDTSREAAESMRDAVRGVRRMVLNFIHGEGDDGATCEEVEIALGMKHQTASAAISTLSNNLELLSDSGKRRKTTSGRQAIVWWTVDPNT